MPGTVLQLQVLSHSVLMAALLVSKRLTLFCRQGKLRTVGLGNLPGL